MKSSNPVFRPTPAQRRLMDYIQANPGFLTVTGFCCAADVDRSSYYDWCHDPDFCA